MPTQPAANPEAVGLSSPRLRRIDTAMQRYIDQGKIPGIQTLLCRRGQIVHQGCYGVMSLATQQPMRPDTLFRIYSMTKIIASTCVMLLAEPHP
jgi:CubicO group peptidase (beta-lactamase class C family)